MQGQDTFSAFLPLLAKAPQRYARHQSNGGGDDVFYKCSLIVNHVFYLSL